MFAASEAASKHGEGITNLTYLDRRAYTRGTDEITRGLAHDMEHEWTRGTTEWKDWKGVEYTDKGVWNYVNGPAEEADCTPGRRDVGNSGRLPSHFLEEINAHIRSRASEFGKDLQEVDQNEVVALRLYTGPAYQPINGWLREVSMLPEEPPGWFQPRWGVWTSERQQYALATKEQDPSFAEGRKEAARDLERSFGATVGHLVSAIRKIAAANSNEESSRRLFRGLKGALQGSFWVEDELGMICATDAAFMSTSLGEDTPIHYMQGNGKPNLLWEIHASPEDEVGYHCGAEVAMLSQFKGEREVLFPPLTMLRVRARSLGDAASSDDQGLEIAERLERAKKNFEVTQDERGCKLFERVSVIASFTG